MAPLVGRSRPTIIRAIVVLPEPDSPTIASDRPGRRRNETSSTATRSPNSLRSPAASRTGEPLLSGIGRLLKLATQLLRPGASGHPAVQLDQLGSRLQADVVGVRAAGREGAFPGRRLEGRQRAARDGAQPGCGVGNIRP